MDIVDGMKIWGLVRDMFEIQASIMIHGCTESKRKRIAKRNDKLAKICGFEEKDIYQIWYE